MIREKPQFILGQNLRRLMHERRIRVSHLSQETEVPKSTVHDWMHGGNPRDVIALKKIANYFSLSIDEICFGDLIPKLKQQQNEVPVEQTEERLNIGSFDVILLRRNS